jgi:hypothetical protein
MVFATNSIDISDMHGCSYCCWNASRMLIPFSERFSLRPSIPKYRFSTPLTKWLHRILFACLSLSQRTFIYLLRPPVIFSPLLSPSS